MVHLFEEFVNGKPKAVDLLLATTISVPMVPVVWSLMRK
jgi:hypothetical protein